MDKRVDELYSELKAALDNIPPDRWDDLNEVLEKDGKKILRFPNRNDPNNSSGGTKKTP